MTIAAYILLGLLSLWLLGGVLVGKIQSGAAILAVSVLGVLAVGLTLISRPAPESSSEQLRKLESVKRSLSELDAYVDQQRRQLNESSETLKKLEEERRRLAPVVTADRAAVEAILSASQRQSREGAWKERLFGFILGIIGSIIASIILKLFEARKRNHAEPSRM